MAKCNLKQVELVGTEFYRTTMTDISHIDATFWTPRFFVFCLSKAGGR